jgi:hypothetical protein
MNVNGLVMVCAQLASWLHHTYTHSHYLLVLRTWALPSHSGPLNLLQPSKSLQFETQAVISKIPYIPLLCTSLQLLVVLVSFLTLYSTSGGQVFLTLCPASRGYENQLLGGSCHYILSLHLQIVPCCRLLGNSPPSFEN